MRLEVGLSDSTKRMMATLRVRTGTLRAAFLQSCSEAADEMADEVVLEASGARLKVRSDGLRRGIKGRAFLGAQSINIAVGIQRGTATAYARIQDEGGEVKAKPGRALPVPLPAAMRGRAVAKSPSELPASIRERLFMLKRPGKDPLLALRREGANQYGRYKSQLEFWYVLKRSVRIPASEWLTGPIMKHAPTLVPAAINSAFERQLGNLK